MNGKVGKKKTVTGRKALQLELLQLGLGKFGLLFNGLLRCFCFSHFNRRLQRHVICSHLHEVVGIRFFLFLLFFFWGGGGGG